MFWEIFRFECRYQLRSPLFLVVAAMFFLLGFLIMGTESVSVGGIGNNLNLNANFAILQTQYTLSVLGMFGAIAFVAGAITRDLELKTAEIFFATGVSQNAYLLGRFASGSLFAVLIGVAGMLGSMVGTFMPWLDQERIGPFTAAPYLFSVWGVIVPNLLVICGLFYSVAALTRSMMAAYVAALGFIVAFIVLINVTDQESIALMSLFDPFGLVAFDETTRYWTVFDRNFGMPEFTDALLYNRLLWLFAAAASVLFTLWRFRFEISPARLLPGRRRGPGRVVAPPAPRPLQVATADGSNVARFLSQLRMDVRGMTRSIPFYVLLAFGMLQVIGSYYAATSQLFGTPVYPVTGLLVRVAGGSFSLAVLVILIYYAGELVHRERQSRVKEILDATPYPNGIMVLSKIAALWFVISAMLVMVLLTSIVVQISKDYYRFEVLLYVQALFGVLGSWYYLLCVPAVLIQVLSPNKFIGMVLFLLFFLGIQTLPSVDYEHFLYRFRLPPAPYSALNGYGHFVEPLLSYAVYWFALAVLMVALAHLFFERGYAGGLANRLMLARQRVSGPVLGVSGAALALALAAGGFIFYNSNVLNEYLTEDEREAQQAEYEKAYKRFEKLPRPEVVNVDVEVDIFPDERRVESRGVALLENRHEQPLETLHLSLSPLLTINAIEIAGATLQESDELQDYYQYEFSPPLAPGATTQIEWNLSWKNEGFPNSGGTTRVVGNGTFFNNGEIMPVPGYDSGRELGDNNIRRKYDLAPVDRLPKLGDPEYLGINQMGVGARSGFRAVVSTSADQIAVAPGYLQRDWTEGDRRYFEYEMDEKIWPFVSFSSARYAVARDDWNGVALEVYYHPEHDFNIDSMMTSAKKSLEYFTREFSPYQYRQFRILEFPAYQAFAQAFPNTIPFSEAIGFIADLGDEKDIDYVFYVTAHELAHQWWAHQVIGARMQGMTVIVETLAQYSALMVMEQEFGVRKMRRFLKYELDNYLRSRGGELIEELPLQLVENQPYIHYRKGSLAMYALRDAIGEDRVNAALRALLDKYAYVEDRFPTSADLIAEFRAVAGPEHQALITDLFEKIVLFDLRVTDAGVVETDGMFDVSVTVSARKLEADGAGEESEVEMVENVELAVFPARGDDLGENDLPEPLLLEVREIRSGEQTLTFRVEQQPASVAVDPYLRMIDRNPDDNLRSL